MPFPLFVFVSSLIAAGTLIAVRLLAQRPWLAITAGLVGATVLLLFLGPVYFDCFADDAYISFRYSDHLAQGLGPNWNSQGRVEGYTSFLWMGTLAGVAKLGFDIVKASEVFGFLALLTTFLFVYRIWRLWAEEEGNSGIQSPVLPAAVFVGLALTDGTTFWGFSGMETPLFTAAITGGAYCYLREQRGARFPWSAVALATASMTRPEGLIAAAVTSGFLLAGLAGAVDRRRSLARLLSWGAVFLLLYGSYFLWRYTYYDHLLPNTFYAKVDLTRPVLERGLNYLWFYGLRYQLLAMVVGIALLLARPRLRHDAAYLLAVSALMLAGVVIEGGDAFGHGRFIVPLLPLLYLGGLAGYATLLQRLALDPARATFVVSAALGLGALSLFPGLREEIICRQVDDIAPRRVLGQWLTEHTPEDFTIAAYAVGALGYYTDRDVLDLLGINDVVIAHTDVPNFGRGIAGHEKYNNDYVLDEVRPEIIIPNDAEPGPITTEEFRARFDPPSRPSGRS
ncbi:MAG: hypothetical protein A2148_09900 [Chloroflexi bacterium RBG_16_68_14]|nr:MAG: hypothetical protein A2148_09900 [Chloroflexi bacterium RBG_16_68_14]